MRRHSGEHPLWPARRAPVRDLQLRERFALAALREGCATDDEVDLLRTSVRVAQGLVQRGYGMLYLSELAAAAATLATPQPCPDLVARALDVHDLQREVAPQRLYVSALTAAATAAP